MLTGRAGRLVTRDELFEAVWPGTVVSDFVLTTTIKELRDAPRRRCSPATRHRDGAPPGLPVSARRQRRRVSAGDAASLASDVAASTSRVVGRRPELGGLTASWHRALAGERQVVFVIGEAASAKTTLVDEFFERSPSPRPSSWRAASASSSVAPASRISPSSKHSNGCAVRPPGRRWSTCCGATRRHGSCSFPGCSMPAECEALERRLGTSTRDRMLREMATLVAAVPAPLVLVLEDLHWSDDSTVDLIATLARRRDAARLLLILTFRPVDVAVRSHPLRAVHQELRAHDACCDLWLPPLTKAATADYLRARWPGLGDVERLAHLGHDRTDGNPLFLVNLADYFEATGAVSAGGGTWHVERDPATLGDDVPPGLRQLLAVQIERLDDVERAALEAASVVGRSFSAALVAAALEADVVAIEGCFAALVHTGMMVRRRWDPRVAGWHRRGSLSFRPLRPSERFSRPGSAGTTPSAARADRDPSRAGVRRTHRRRQHGARLPFRGGRRR
jgi:hypothetical protein